MIDMNDPFWIGFRRGLIQGTLIGLPFLIAALTWGFWQ